MRYALALVLAAGCDSLLHLDPAHTPVPDAPPDAPADAPPDAPPRPCDIFSTVDTVSFSGFTPVSDFSVERTGHYAIAIGDPGGGPDVPHMLYRQDPASPWGVAGGGLDTLPSTLRSPRIATMTDMFGSKPPSGTALFVQVFESTYNGTWTSNGSVAAANGDELTTGYVMEPDGKPRVVVVDQRPSVPNVILFRRHEATSWLPEPQDFVSATGNVTSGALTDDALTLVYAVDGLYVSHRIGVNQEFPAGKRVQLPGGVGREVEPWPSADCSELYFRRDATIYVAR